MKKRIIWVSTGGTFACKYTENGLAPFSDEEFMENVIKDISSEFDENIEFINFPVLNKDSSEINLNDCFNIADIIREPIKNHLYEGIIITHGTDTMAYTAAMLSVIHKNPDIPIIFTGSQLPYKEKNSDAKKNFTDSVNAILSNKLKGVFVVFDSFIYHALDCYKASTNEYDAFCQYDMCIGNINNGKVEIIDNSRMSEGEYKYNASAILKVCDKVQLIKLTPGFDENVIDYYVEKGVKGIVIEGYGTGGIPERVVKKLRMAKEKGVLSMVITQCKRGGTSLQEYKVGTNVTAAGIIEGKKLGAEGAMATMMEICGKL